MDGRKGLVPSNFIQRLQGEDLVEFHRAAVLGLQIGGDDSSTTSLPRDVHGFSPNHSASRQGQQQQQHRQQPTTHRQQPHQQHLQQQHQIQMQHEPIDQGKN